MHFRNGAIAIPYLTTLLLQLHDEQVLDLEDRLAEWFPDYPAADRITLRMLADNTAGYADYVYDIPIYDDVFRQWAPGELRSEEHTSELQSLMRISYAVFCLKKKKN